MHVSFQFTENKIKDVRLVLFTNCLKTRLPLALSDECLNDALKILYLIASRIKSIDLFYFISCIILRLRKTMSV